MRIGVICPSEIAIRRFMPALQKCKDITFTGISVFNKEERFGETSVSDDEFDSILNAEKKKALPFVEQYGGKMFDSYYDLASSSEVDAIYIPLPPALHYRWAKAALEHGKHVLVEKPSTINSKETEELAMMARDRGLAFHENYMFVFHNQLDAIEKLIRDGEIGDVRLYRISFGFPQRSLNDFRYNKSLGGGALIDAGGYTIRYATRLLGPTARIRYAQSNYVHGFEVDMYGSAALTNSEGITAQIAFGMDNNYKCELEAWGSKGCLTTGRVLTAPVGFVPTAIIRRGNDETVVNLPEDDSFFKSIRYFYECTKSEELREISNDMIIKQAHLVDEFKKMAGWESK